MAQGRIYICENCGKSVEAWDEGNPYFLDQRGKKQYRYHPDRERDLCIGNDSDLICLDLWPRV